jgi:trehalose/maltose hydrolase-like predicted phosphorylase
MRFQRNVTLLPGWMEARRGGRWRHMELTAARRSAAEHGARGGAWTAHRSGASIPPVDGAQPW